MACSQTHKYPQNLHSNGGFTEDISRYYTLLREPTRRKIIEILGDRGKVGFKELKEELGLGVGTIYYHLDMLSDFITQDKHRKYSLNDHGRLLYRLLKEGGLPPPLEMRETFSHLLGRWLFLSPIFIRTTRPERLLPLSLLVWILGAVGSAFAKLEPMLFFYFPSTYKGETIITLFLANWTGLFLLLNLLVYAFYRKTGGEFQFFTCMGIATFPLALFPYIYLFISSSLARYILLILQIWTLLLLSSALCFGKGLRLDKAIIISLIVLYVNIALLMIFGRLE
ncbi:MAG: winged helix-turn-helix domain-containing protein [Candidatus Freyarchaeota archaeon]